MPQQRVLASLAQETGNPEVLGGEVKQVKGNKKKVKKGGRKYK
jgi:hypothetical protein